MARFSPGLQSAINNLMSGRGTPLRLNPAGRTIEARRSGTCPISGEAISPGDSITKTEAGWVLSQHAGAAMENPRQIKRGKGRFVQTPQSVREQDRYTAAAEMAYFEGGPGERYLTSSAPIRKYQQLENPGMGGKAMKYARTHGMSLKEGWAAVKAGKSNPATPPSGPSASSLIRKAKDHDLFVVPRSPTKVDFHSDSGYDGMGGAYIGSVSVNGDIVTFVGFEPPGKSFAVKILNPRKATAAIVSVADALNAGYDDLAATVTEFADGVLQLVGESGRSNPYFENGMGGSAMKYARDHGVSLKKGWAAVKSGLSNPYHNPNKEAEVQALARQVLRFWPKVSPTAEQQLFFMLNPEYIQGGDSIEMVVASFLGNALGWRGEDARRIKAQLNALLR